jgi:hypothetical protein
MFKMLVFILSFEALLTLGWIGLSYLSFGRLVQSLPYLAIVMMCVSYFMKGASETISYIKSHLK